VPKRTATTPDERLAEMAKALGHPVRVRVLRRLVGAGTCVCGDFTAELGLAQSTLWKHLDILKRAGLIRGTIDGKAVCYCADPDGIREMVDAIGELGDRGRKR
jgi:ArsR family transcriptional regulator